MVEEVRWEKSWGEKGRWRGSMDEEWCPSS